MLTLAKIRPPEVIVREWLHDPRALTFGLLACALGALGLAFWLILRNLRHNEPGLSARMAFVLALVAATTGLVGAHRLTEDRFLTVGGGLCCAAGSLFWSAAFRISELARRISSCKRPTALFRASSERKELEHTNSASESV